MKKPILIAVAVFMTFVLVGWGAWAISVAVSGPKGQGDAIKTKNSAENWTAAQARFERQYQTVITSDEKITVAEAAVAAKPDDYVAQTTLQGLKSACISARGDYNAESRKFLSADFKAVDLPAEIDSTNPRTDCK